MYLGNLHAGKTDHHKAAFESYALKVALNGSPPTVS
jgi:hypothetical protein